MAMKAAEAQASAGFETIPRNKVYQAVAKQLERHITEDLKPGDLLPPERQLVEMLGVSRGSVRDAIRSLELMGLLEPRQGVGTVVRSRGASAANPLARALREKQKQVAELIDVRKMIEPHLAARAAVHAPAMNSPRWKRSWIVRRRKCAAGELAVEEDSEFHYSIASGVATTARF